MPPITQQQQQQRRRITAIQTTPLFPSKTVNLQAPYNPHYNEVNIQLNNNKYSTPSSSLNNQQYSRHQMSSTKYR